jgi:hypothetical protein
MLPEPAIAGGHDVYVGAEAHRGPVPETVAGNDARASRLRLVKLDLETGFTTQPAGDLGHRRLVAGRILGGGSDQLGKSFVKAIRTDESTDIRPTRLASLQH